jgi:hypothetical protein
MLVGDATTAITRAAQDLNQKLEDRRVYGFFIATRSPSFGCIKILLAYDD